MQGDPRVIEGDVLALIGPEAEDTLWGPLARRDPLLAQELSTRAFHIANGDPATVKAIIDTAVWAVSLRDVATEREGHEFRLFLDALSSEAGTELSRTLNPDQLVLF